MSWRSWCILRCLATNSPSSASRSLACQNRSVARSEEENRKNTNLLLFHAGSDKSQCGSILFVYLVQPQPASTYSIESQTKINLRFAKEKKHANKPNFMETAMGSEMADDLALVTLVI